MTRIVNQRTLIKQLIALSKTKDEPFDEERELEELRQIREEVWQERYERGFLNKSISRKKGI